MSRRAARAGLALAAAMLGLAAPAAAQPGTLALKVSDLAGAPLAGVVARLDGVERGRTGADGRLKLARVPPGWHAVKLGGGRHALVGVGVVLPPGGEAWLEVGLARDELPAVRLPVLKAVAGAELPPGAPPAAGGKGGSGRSWSGDAIRRAHPTRLSDLLRDAPEVEVVPGAGGGVLRFRRTFSARPPGPSGPGVAPPDCAPEYYVDGVRFPGAETPDLFPPAEVEEVTLFPGNVPAVYGGMRASCGAVVIRTRRGAAAAAPKPRAVSYAPRITGKPGVPPRPGKRTLAKHSPR